MQKVDLYRKSHDLQRDQSETRQLGSLFVIRDYQQIIADTEFSRETASQITLADCSEVYSIATYITASTVVTKIKKNLKCYFVVY